MIHVKSVNNYSSQKQNYLNFLPGQKPRRFENINRNDVTLNEKGCPREVAYLTFYNCIETMKVIVCIHHYLYFTIRHKKVCHAIIQIFRYSKLIF
jgi:hypothetical protein